MRCPCRLHLAQTTSELVQPLGGWLDFGLSQAWLWSLGHFWGKQFLNCPVCPVDFFCLPCFWDTLVTVIACNFPWLSVGCLLCRVATWARRMEGELGPSLCMWTEDDQSAVSRPRWEDSRTCRPRWGLRWYLWVYPDRTGIDWERGLKEWFCHYWLVFS
jgi:hypothetical protein